MDKQKPTASDLETEEVRRLAKSEVGLANVRAKSEREKKLASSHKSPFQGNITAKIIIPNKKIGRGYDPFALPVDKRRSSALTDMLKKDRFYRTTPKKKPPGCPSLWYWTLRTPLEWLTDSHMDAFINVLRKRYTNDPHMFRSERMCILDHAFAQWWMSKYPDWTNKIWGIHVDDIYAPVNYKNSHWLAIWISILKRHMVVWDRIVGCIRKAQLDQVMAPFVNMVPYLLVECAATVEERCKYSLEPFTYEVANAPQCESGDCGLFALKYIECHALGFPFSGSLNPKNSKAIREKMVVDDYHQTTYKRHTDDFQTSSTRRIPPDDIQTTSRRLPPGDIQTITTRRHTDDFWTTTKRLPPEDFHQTTYIRLPDDFQMTFRRLPSEDFHQMTSRRLAPDDLQMTSRRLLEVV
ncbi:hypothetical protein N665_0223s0019 [Sinapis alba]|nr:hypothetical protein N665_0223s0019 [Sinapis alba]